MDTATLREHDQADFGHIFLIDGVSIGFTDRAEIAEHVVPAGGQSLRIGLKVEGLQPRDGTDFRDARLKSNTMQIRIEDFVGDLAELFASEDADETQLLQHVDAGEDLTTRTELHGLCVGIETIGPNGERHQYPVPDEATWGFQHWGLSNAEHLTLSPAPVTASPIVWRGRRCMLYRVFREPLPIPSGLVFAPDLQTLVDPVSGLTGTATGTRYVASRRARFFDGVGDQIAWPNVEDATGVPISGSCWIRFDDVAAFRRFFQISVASTTTNAVVMRIRSDGRLEFFAAYSSGAALRRTNKTFDPDTWYHIAWTYDGSGQGAGISIYVDGVEQTYITTSNGSSGANAANGDWVVGGSPGNAEDFEGLIVAFRVWLRELSPSEVSSLHRNGWRPWSEAEPRWWGTLEDRGEALGRHWTFEAAGKESWLRKDLGLLSQRTPVIVRPQNATEIPASKRHFVGMLWEQEIGPDNFTNYGYGLDEDWSTTISGDTVVEMRESLENAVFALAAAVGVDGAFTDQDGRAVAVDTNTGSIGIATQDSGPLEDPTDTVLLGYLWVALHREMWAALGFDVGQIGAQQVGEATERGQAGLEPTNELYVNFDADLPLTVFDEPPAPGYVLGVFTTLPTNFDFDAPSLAHSPTAELIDNNGALRHWRPRYLGGTAALRHDLDGGQVLDLGAGLLDTNIAAQGQLWRPPASDPSDPSSGYTIAEAGEVDRCGLWLLFGKRRWLGSDDEFDEYQVAECSWVEGVLGGRGLVASSRLVVTRWLDPRDFGFDRPPLSSDWVVRTNAVDEYSIHAVPLCMLGYRPAGYKDDVHVVIQRLLRSTGTSTGWDSFADNNPDLDPGDNEPTLVGFVRHDAEVADLGLGIPSSMVQSPLQWAAEAALRDPELRKMRLAVSPGMHTEDVLQGLMQPLGWCWSLVGNRYGIFSPYDYLTQQDVDVVLTRAQKRGRISGQIAATAIPIRRHAPIDTFDLDYSWTPHLDKTSRQDEHQSPDKGRRYRPGGMPYRLRGLGLRHDPIQGVPRGWRERADEIARWWERRHFAITGWPVMRIPGQDLAIGSVVRITEPTGTDPAGSYGITGRIGRVFGVTEDIATGNIAVDILVQASVSTLPRVHAVSARGIGHDPATDRIYTASDWLGQGAEGWSDVAFFVEPSYEGLAPFGGDAAVRWLQWDRAGFRGFTGSGTVDSVGVENGIPYIQLTGAITGDYFRDMDTVIVFSPHDDQPSDSWIRELFGVVANDDGEFGSGPTDGFRWEA